MCFNDGSIYTKTYVKPVRIIPITSTVPGYVYYTVDQSSNGTACFTMPIGYEDISDDECQELLTEQRAQLERMLAVFDAVAEFYLIDHNIHAIGGHPWNTGKGREKG